MSFSRVFTIAVGTLLVLMLASCASIPSGGPRPDSLLLVITRDALSRRNGSLVVSADFSGPEAFSIRLDKKGEQLHAIRVPAGEYRLESLTLPDHRRIWINSVQPIVLSPGTAVLLPYLPDESIRSIQGPGGEIDVEELDVTDLVPLRPEDQRAALNIVQNQFRFRDWLNGDFLGFGAYSPRSILSEERLPVEVRTDPSGLDVIIDGENWGAAPLEVELTQGKHFVLVEAEGYKAYRSFHNVDGPGELDISLEPGSDSADAGQGYHLVAAPFLNLGDGEYDYLASVFSDSIGGALTQSGDITVTFVPPELLSGDDRYAALLNAGESSGAQMFISGRYLTTGDELFVQASLIDVRTELVKASIMYSGKAGLEVFDSIDSMTGEFLQDVNRVLPDVGKRVIEKRSETDQEFLRFQERVTDRDIIETRKDWTRSWDVTMAYGTLSDYVYGVPWQSDPINRYQGPGLVLSLGYQFPLNSKIDLSLKFNPTLVGIDSSWNSTFIDLPLYFGPRFTFNAMNSDIYLGTLANLRFGTPTTFYEDSGPGTYPTGPFLNAGLDLDIGVKLYNYKSRDARPRYIDIGMILGLGGMSYNFASGDLSGYSLDLWLYGGYGSKLR